MFLQTKLPKACISQCGGIPNNITKFEGYEKIFTLILEEVLKYLNDKLEKRKNHSSNIELVMARTIKFNPYFLKNKISKKIETLQCSKTCRILAEENEETVSTLEDCLPIAILSQLVYLGKVYSFHPKFTQYSDNDCSRKWMVCC